ncbi:DUF1737 domain-containing protein [Streptomyces sp. NBC_01185]|uniref:DUF1737 domain-containing protein n=1 Tax=Streptomyces sp. NBC_01185 TaxID=2903764 RepID=UPI003866A4E6|nr:DUF1737 domain-containing protein [Streptomyces sp. NBC_01185]
MSTPPDGLPAYRAPAGRDDATFCRRVSEALALGYEPQDGPAVTFDGRRVIVAQALVRPARGQVRRSGAGVVVEVVRPVRGRALRPPAPAQTRPLV